MTTRTVALLLQGTDQSKGPGPLARLRAHLTGITAAHASRARLSRLTGADTSDTGLSPEDLLGESRHAAALPFFFQPGFDRL